MKRHHPKVLVKVKVISFEKKLFFISIRAVLKVRVFIGVRLVRHEKNKLQK